LRRGQFVKDPPVYVIILSLYGRKGNRDGTLIDRESQKKINLYPYVEVNAEKLAA